MKKNYYVADSAYADNIYGSESPVCIDLAEVRRLAREWGMTADELLDQMHEASTSEIAEHGVYDSVTNLKRIRTERGMSQSELSRASGVQTRQIQFYEQQFRDINSAAAMTVHKLAVALGCSVEDIIQK